MGTAYLHSQNTMIHPLYCQDTPEIKGSYCSHCRYKKGWMNVIRVTVMLLLRQHIHCTKKEKMNSNKQDVLDASDVKRINNIRNWPFKKLKVT